MYQDITETMLGLLGNIFQSIYFCFDNYQVYPLIWSISGYLQVSYLLQQDEYLANITRAGCRVGSAGQTAAAAVMILNTTLAKVTAKGHYGIWVSSRDITWTSWLIFLNWALYSFLPAAACDMRGPSPAQPSPAQLTSCQLHELIFSSLQ